MENEKFDQILKRALENKVRDMAASPYLLEYVKIEAEARSRKERKFMGISKKIAVAAAVCVMSVTAYAAVSNLAGTTGGTTKDIKTFAQLEKADDKLGLNANLVESFSNGMTFKDGGIGENYGVDENGNEMGKAYKRLSASYEDKDGNRVTLIIDEGNHYVDAGQEASKGYSAHENLFVPPDYEPTEEELALQKAGKLNIGYGADEVERTVSESYYWQEDGLYYGLIGFDLNLGEEGFAQMAAEIME